MRTLSYLALLTAIGVTIGSCTLVVANHAHADSMLGKNPPVETSTPDATKPQVWRIEVLLAVNNQIIHAINYGDKTFPTTEACEEVAKNDAQLNSSARRASVVAAKEFGPTAAIGIACALDQ